MKIRKNVALFTLGGLVYMGLELLWRRRTHWSMFLAGGICFLLIGKLEHTKPRLPPLPRALVGAGIITMVELAAGLLFNRDWTVWDYRTQPGNFLGMICPLFSILWIPMATVAARIYLHLEQKLERYKIFSK